MKRVHGLGEIEIRHLEAFVVVARERSFTRAGEALGYTQSGISHQIRSLERVLGTRLLDRPRGRTLQGLTDEGEVFLQHAEAILTRLRAARADLKSVSDAFPAPIRIGTYQSIGTRILPAVVRDLSEKWPRVRFNLHLSPSDYDLFARVERSDVDVCFCMLPILDGPFEALELHSDPYVLVVPRDAELEGAPTLRDIAKLPLIASRTCRNEHRVEERLRAEGLSPRIVFRSDDNGTVAALVAAGVGAALMPRLTVNLGDPRFVIYDVGDLLPARVLGAVWHRDRSLRPVMRSLIDCVNDGMRGVPHTVA